MKYKVTLSIKLEDGKTVEANIGSDEINSLSELHDVCVFRLMYEQLLEELKPNIGN